MITALRPPALIEKTAELRKVHLTHEPGCVDVVGALSVGGRVEVDPGGVGGEVVGALVLHVVAHLQRGRVLRLWRVVRSHKLERK